MTFSSHTMMRCKFLPESTTIYHLSHLRWVTPRHISRGQITPNKTCQWSMDMGIKPLQICTPGSEELCFSPGMFDGKYRIPTRADNPFPTNYCADTDITEPLTPEYSSFYQHLIGVMWWMVEQGHVDIATEVSLLLSYLAYPC